jgi:hypothetical protein
MNMARSWGDQQEAAARVCGCFTDGVDTLDLKEGKALLDEST